MIAEPFVTVVVSWEGKKSSKAVIPERVVGLDGCSRDSGGKNICVFYIRPFVNCCVLLELRVLAVGLMAIPGLSWVARVWHCSEQTCELWIFLLFAVLGGRLSALFFVLWFFFVFFFEKDFITSIHCLYHLHVQSALVSVAIYLPWRPQGKLI